MKLFVFILVVSVFCSCGEKEKSKIVHTVKNGKQINEFKEDYTFIEIADLPIQIDSTDYLIHPIGEFAIEDSRKKSYVKYSSSLGKNFSVSNYNKHKLVGNLSNVKFQHIDSEELRLLTQKAVKIKSLSFLRKIFDSTKKQLLVYEVIDKDSNQDGKLNQEDIKTLYISKIDGTEFQKLSDNNKELIDWKVNATKNRLYFRTIEDSNKDGKFDNEDTLHYQFIDLIAENFNVKSYKPI